MREQVLAAIKEHVPERLHQVLEDNLRPSIAFSARETDDDNLAVGASKIRRRARCAAGLFMAAVEGKGAWVCGSVRSGGSGGRSIRSARCRRVGH